jgi:hypothetical protein
MSEEYENYSTPDEEHDEVAEVTKDLQSPGQDASDEELEEFVQKILVRAASLKAVRIDRDVFLRTIVKKYYPEGDADAAVQATPAQAGIPDAKIDEMARASVDFETSKCAALSFAAGIPGGVALVGTVPADLAQYFVHVMRVEQKLAYLYGWQSFLNEDDEVDDETIAMLVMLMGVMMGVGEAANTFTKFASTTAQSAVSKKVASMALTKTAFYNPMKKVLRDIGINVTKKSFGEAVGKAVPVIGGVISGGITYATFKPSSEKLRQYLRALPISGIDTSVPEEVPLSYLAEMAASARVSAGSIVSRAGDAAKTAAPAIADGAKAAGAALGQSAGIVGKAALDGVKGVGDLAAHGVQAGVPTVADGIAKAGDAVASGVSAFGGLFEGFGKKAGRAIPQEIAESTGDADGDAPSES